MIRSRNSAIIAYIICCILATTMSIGTNNSESQDVKSVLADLQKLATLLQSVNSINDRLLGNLRDNATHLSVARGKPEDLKKQGYLCINGIGWHKLFLNNLTWNEARKACRRDGAHLAILNSQSEAKTLRSLLLENYQFSAYIGIHNQFKEDEWVTVFGDPLTETGYNRWSVGPPKISEANCGVLFEDGKLLGIPCHVERSYFCEVPGMPTC